MKRFSKKLIKIGKIKAPKGLKGEIKVFLYSGQAPWADCLSVVYLEFPNQSVSPKGYKVSRVSTGELAKKKCLLLKLEGVDDRNESEKLQSAEVLIDEKLLQSQVGEKIFLREILGFSVISDSKDIGVITGFETNGAQDLLVVELRKNESPYENVLIPFVKDFLVTIDFQRKIVEMVLPEGLVPDAF